MPAAHRTGHPEEDELQASSSEPLHEAAPAENGIRGKRQSTRSTSKLEDRSARREGQEQQFRANPPHDPAGHGEILRRAPARENEALSEGPRREGDRPQARPVEARRLAPAAFQDLPALPALDRPAQVLRPAQPAVPPEAEPPMGPVIRVHIERIEVRAVPAPAAAPDRPLPAPRPRLSLDEYLRQRNEGQR